jgi:putative hemolysin
VILIFGEVFPKSLATRYPLQVSQVIVYPLIVMEYTLFPIIWLFEKLLSLVIGHHIQAITEDEVKAMVSMGAEEGSLETHEKVFIENVLRFNDIPLEDIVTPRTEIVALEDDVLISEAIDFVREQPFSRFPVYRDSIDNILGFITVKKLFDYSTNKSMLNRRLGDVDLFEFIKVPSTMTIYGLFLSMQRSRIHIALVYDEHGGLEGIVTMEDILEEIVGEIEDEADKVEENIEMMSPRVAVVDGDTEIEDIAEALSVEIPSYDGKDTASWVILDFLKRFPRKGESVVIDDVKFTVQKMDSNNKKILKVRVEK